MIKHRLHQLASGRVAGVVAAGAWLLGIGTVRAADPLPRPASFPSIKTVSANYRLPLATPAGPQLSAADPNPIPAVDCTRQCPSGHKATWRALGPVAAFQQWGPGEYVGRSRLPHVPVYRLRVDDSLEFEFRVDHERIPGHYKINVGDELTVESATVADLARTLVVLPDGTITLPLVGQVQAAGRTIAELRDDLEEKFQKHYEDPAISVNPFKVNTQLEELRFAVGGLAGFAKQVLSVPVTPEGTVQLPAVGSVPAQGLTLDELKMELDERFAEEIEGIEVVPALRQHGPRYVYVLGEVAAPGRYQLEAPTTIMQAISMAGSWTVGAHLTNVVVFRRADDWQLIATKLDLRPALVGRTPCPEGEIWVSDADLVIVPKSKILRADNFIELVFTRGIYGVLPVNGRFQYRIFKGVIPFVLP